jgi:hypothetical protein
MPNTILWRNLLLSFGSIFSFLIIYRNLFLISILNNFSIKMLGLLLTWVFFHYLFISMEPNLQLKELSGLWLRSVLAMLMAVSLALYLSTNPQSVLLLGICVGATVLINISFYVFYSLQVERFLLPGEVMGRPFHKIETVFWGSLWIAYALANLQYLISHPKTINRLKYTVLWINVVIVALISSLLTSAKNGIVAGIALACIFAGLFFVQMSRERYRIKVGVIFLSLIISIFIFGYWYFKTTAGWATFFSDSRVALQIDQYQQWKKPLEGIPSNVTAPNTYARVAWASVGFRIITDHPLGYGLVNQSFERWLDYLGIDHQTNRQTHMGWIDFGLAFGFPGVLILWSAIFFIIYKGFRQKKLLSLIAGWTCLAIFGLGLISEIFYKQFFEAIMFWITFGAVAVSVSKKHENKSIEL